ncbi:hypothetical protein, partial [Vibrio vulnificus]|uniref:hypothetical protein n=1 Tax=Vibrio vulnificus TaxID=672 RepID=UPI001C3F28F1
RLIVFITLRIKRRNNKHILLTPYALKLCRGHKFATRGVEKTPATSAGVAKKSQISSISKANIFDL